MNLPRKDLVATGIVALAAVLYLLWVADLALPGMDDVRVTAAGILVLGFVASAFAVVPAFDQLIHGSKTYLATTAVLGVAALAAGVLVMLTSDGLALAGLIAATVVLWAISTAHHMALATQVQEPARTEARPRVAAHSH